MRTTIFLALWVASCSPAMALVDPDNPWAMNTMPLCIEGRCTTHGMSDSWGPYPDEATCLARIEEMRETITPLLRLQYGPNVEMKPMGCTNHLGESV